MIDCTLCPFSWQYLNTYIFWFWWVAYLWRCYEMWRLKLATLNRNDGRALKMLLIVAWKATIIALCPFLFELNILFCDRPLWKSRAYNTKNSTPEICVFQLRRTNDATSLRQTNYILFLLLYSRLMFGQNRSVKSWKEWNCCAMRRMAKKKMKEAIRKSIQFDWMNWS